jgi:hypothetical protein
VSLSPGGGTGTGSTFLTVAPNNGPSYRLTTVTLAGLPLVVHQLGGPVVVTAYPPAPVGAPVVR